MEGFLNQIGVHMSDLFAGFSGGILAALVTSGPRPKIWGIFCSIVVGALAGAYFGPIVPAWFGIKPSAGASAGVGVAGMPLCRGIIAAAQRVKWSPNVNPSGGSNA